MSRSLSRLLMPDYDFPTYDRVTPEFLRGLGVTMLISDLDNTLAPYEQAEPDDRFREWFSALSAAGISLVLISNNKPERVELFNRSLGLIAFPDAHKPSRKAMRRILADTGASEASTAMLGDQLLTDVLMAHRAGLTAILVPPIRDKKTLFFRFKRLIEKPFLKKYFRRKRRSEKEML